MDRYLAAIVLIDAVAFSEFAGRDEAGAYRALKGAFADVVEPRAEAHRGRIIKLLGDGALIEFLSVVDATRFAIDLQLTLLTWNAQRAAADRIAFRAGINLGDVIRDGEDVFGDGVNVAERLQALAPAGGVCLSRSVRDQIRDKLDLTLEDQGEIEVKNIPRPVRAFHIALDDKARALAAEPHETAKTGPSGRAGSGLRRRRLALAAAGAVLLGTGGWIWYQSQGPEVFDLPNGPRIAIMPFEALGGADQRYFSAGLTADIIADLSRFTNLFVLDSYSTAQLETQNLGCRGISDELNANFILDGSVRQSAERLRVGAKLIASDDCTTIWSEDFEGDLSAASIFDFQDKIAARVVASVGSHDAPLWNSRTQRRVQAARTDSLDAYNCVLLSYWFYETFAAEEHRRAKECLERAVEIDPDYSMAWSRLAFTYIEEKKYGYNTEPEPLKRADAAAQRAVALNPLNQDAFYALAIKRYMDGEDFALFYEAADRAIEMNPNNAWVLADLGTWIAYSGDWERGKALVRKSMALNPRHQRWMHYAFALDAFLEGDYDEALKRHLAMNLPKNYMVQGSLAATYAEMGDLDAARQALARALEAKPDFAADPRAPYAARRMPEDLIEKIVAGLTKAGLTPIN